MVIKDGTLIGIILTLLGIMILILREWIKTRNDIKELHEESIKTHREFSAAYKLLTEKTLQAIYDNKEATNSIKSTLLITKEVTNELKNAIDIMTQTIINSFSRRN